MPCYATGYADADGVGMLRGFRLVRLWRRSRAGMTGGAGGTFLRVAYIIFGWILAAHVCACIFFAIGWRSRCHPYEDTWVSAYFDDLRLNERWACPATPSLRNVLDESNGSINIAELYVLSFYWALSSMSSLGYGNGPKAVTIA
jgi:hypothetical protein